MGVADTDEVLRWLLGEVWREMAHPLLLCLLDGGDLLCHHRQHLNIDAIKLIKAGPGPRAK